MSNLIISGVIDGPLTGGLPKAIELFAVEDIPDLSLYAVGSANNGGGSDGAEKQLAGTANAGDYLYVATESTGFQNFFGFAPTFEAAAASINGDDAIELFRNGEVVDVFGDINVDGSGQAWEYLDGWVYRKVNTGPDGQVFVFDHWRFSGVNALDDVTTNATAATPFPVGTFDRNNAPVLDGNATFTAIAEDTPDPDNSGDTVAELLTGSVTDADPEPTGIAVTAVDETNGTWQYSTDGGSTWQHLPADAAVTNAITLDATARIRFVPDADYYGQATIQFRAWDTTDGSSTGQTGIDASQSGGFTAFSAAFGIGTITVNSAAIAETSPERPETSEMPETPETAGASEAILTPPCCLSVDAFFSFEMWVVLQAIQTGQVFQSALVDFNVEIGGLRIAPLFDETHYLNANPDVAAAVQQGVFQYGFEHFVLFGMNEGRSPGSWFDTDYYLAQNADVAAAVQGGTMPSAIAHFLLFGHRENRDPSAFFAASDYLLNHPDVNAAVTGDGFDSGFEHYSEFGAKEGRTSGLLFQESFYLQQNPDVAAAVESGAFALGLYHFLYFGQGEGRDPSPLFDQSAYLERYGDVAAAVTGGAFASAFEHYVLFGRAEGRTAV